MGRKGRALPSARPESSGGAESAVGSVPVNAVSGGNGAGSSTVRRGTGPGFPLPKRPVTLATDPDPDRVIEPEPKPPGPDAPPAGSAPEPPGGPPRGRDTSQSEPPGRPEAPVAGPDKPADGAVVPRPSDQPVAGPALPKPGTGTELDRQTAAPVVPRTGTGLTPSWANVIGTTVRLWVQRRRTAWRVIAAIVVALIVFAAGGLTVALIRGGGSAGSARGSGGKTASAVPGLSAVQAAAAARQQTAKWIAAQVSHSTVVSCDPAMCAALQAQGFPAGDLMTLGPGASDPLGSAVIVATAAIRSQFGSRLTTVYAPTVLASFGSGAARIDVRAYAAGGAAQYLAALRADELSRARAGSQLLRNSRVSVAPAARQQLAAGQVDSRLLITIATLSGQGPVSVVAFGDAGPGASAGMPLREAELGTPSGAKSGYLPSVLALLRAQQAPYLANSVTLARLASGQEVVRVEFTAPSPFGLLSS
jgi:hypothetical protein